MPRGAVRGGAGRGRANPRRAAARKARGATPRRPLGGGPRGGGRGRAQGMNPARRQARLNRQVTRPIPANPPNQGGYRVPPSMGGQMRGLGMRRGPARQRGPGALPRPIGPSPIPFKRPGPPVKGRVYRRGGLVRGR